MKLTIMWAGMPMLLLIARTKLWMKRVLRMCLSVVGPGCLLLRAWTMTRARRTKKSNHTTLGFWPSLWSKFIKRIVAKHTTWKVNIKWLSALMITTPWFHRSLSAWPVPRHSQTSKRVPSKMSQYYPSAKPMPIHKIKNWTIRMTNKLNTKSMTKLMNKEINRRRLLIQILTSGWRWCSGTCHCWARSRRRARTTSRRLPLTGPKFLRLKKTWNNNTCFRRIRMPSRCRWTRGIPTTIWRQSSRTVHSPSRTWWHLANHKRTTSRWERPAAYPFKACTRTMRTQ